MSFSYLPSIYNLEKRQHGKVLSELLVEMATHDWADLGNAREMDEEIHATYCREMENTWGPDHITAVPEDYAQHVILGIHMSYFAYACKFGLPTSCLPPNFRSYRKSKINII